jgi:hypothetical protein
MRERTHLHVLLLALSLPAQAPQPQPLAPQRSRLEGKVVDPQQRPVANAHVTAEANGLVVARTQTDSQGTFVFGRLPADFVVVRATTDAPDIGATWCDLLGNRREFARITTMPARKLTGTVLDDTGQPVAGAWVAAAPSDLIEFAFASCTAFSDAAGHYELTHVAMGPVLVRAWARGFDGFVGSLDSHKDEALDCHIERDASQEHTFALDGAKPERLPFAKLHVDAWHGGLPVPLPPALQALRPDEGGVWHIRGWPYDDELRARLELPGALITPPMHTALADRGGSKHRFAVDDESACLRGKLVGADGQTLGHCGLIAQPLNDGGNQSYRRVIARTEADGTFLIPSPVDRGETVALRAYDGEVVVVGQPQQSRAWYVAKYESQSFEIAVKPAYRIRMRVFGRNHVPAPGARVAIYAALPTAQPVRGLMQPMHSEGMPIAFGTSDLDGNVEINALDLRTSETLCCLATCEEGFAESPFQVKEATTIELGEVTLQEAARVRLRANQDPHAGLRVTYSQVYSNLGPDNVFTVIDRDGYCCFVGLLPGAAQIFLLSPKQLPIRRLEAGPNEGDL